jgi:hypothetical protein
MSNRRTALPSGGQYVTGRLLPRLAAGRATGDAVTTPAVHLDDASVEAIARRVAELLSSEGGSEGWIDAAEVARRFSFSRDFVYEHSAELGAVRIGSGPKARLRFDPNKVAEALGGSFERESRPKREAVRSVRRGRGVTLLPIRGESP